MRNAIRLSALAAGLLLLATPVAWACNESGGMSECSRGAAKVTSPDMSCEEAEQPSMDCCGTRAGAELGPSPSVQSTPTVSPADSAPRVSVVPTVAARVAGTGEQRALWLTPERYALFSSYLI